MWGKVILWEGGLLKGIRWTDTVEGGLYGMSIGNVEGGYPESGTRPPATPKDRFPILGFPGNGLIPVLANQALAQKQPLGVR